MGLSSSGGLSPTLPDPSTELSVLPLSFQNIPTLGSVAVTMALHGCDEVAVAGFGYDMNTPNAPLHYYETVRMAAIKEVRAGQGGQSLGGAGSRHLVQRMNSSICRSEC